MKPMLLILCLLITSCVAAETLVFTFDYGDPVISTMGSQLTLRSFCYILRGTWEEGVWSDVAAELSLAIPMTTILDVEITGDGIGLQVVPEDTTEPLANPSFTLQNTLSRAHFLLTAKELRSLSAKLVAPDATLDGAVNILDLIFVRQRLGLLFSPGDYETARADINDDGAVNLLDLLALRARIRR